MYGILARIENEMLNPPEDKRAVCAKCDICGEDILEDDDIYEFLSLSVCQSCIDDAHSYAERDAV